LAIGNDRSTTSMCSFTSLGKGAEIGAEHNPIDPHISIAAFTPIGLNPIVSARMFDLK
jgi:hypothetical protein